MTREEILNQQRTNAAERYKPQHIRLLLVAQMPPRAGSGDAPRYFYFEDVTKHDDLFRGVVKAVLGAEPIRRNKAALLTRLREQGVFLIDLKPNPIDPRPLTAFVPALVERCRLLRPDNIILIKVDVYDVAFQALCEAGLPVVNARIPFPGSGQQLEFASGMERALNEAKGSMH